MTRVSHVREEASCLGKNTGRLIPSTIQQRFQLACAPIHVQEQPRRNGRCPAPTIEISFVSWLDERFELARDGHTHNLLPMEGLRGLAVSLVFLVHYSSLIAPWIEGVPVLSVVSSVMHTIGNTGVDLFFVLSGYLIYGSLIKCPQPFQVFIRRRVERIYPTFLTVFSVYLVLSFVFPNESKIPNNALDATLYLIGNILLLPGIFPIDPMISVAWSLSYELFYYLLIPIVIGTLRLREHSVAWRTRFFLLASAVMFVAYSLWGGPIRLLMFVAGMLLSEAIAIERGRSSPGILGFAALLTGVSLTLVPMPFQGGLGVRTLLMAVAFFFVCLVCLQNPHTWFSRILCWKPLRWLGNMSYSYYLLHGLVLKGCFFVLLRLYPPGEQQVVVFWGGLLVCFFLTVLFSSLLFLSIERPLSLVPGGRISGHGHRA